LLFCEKIFQFGTIVIMLHYFFLAIIYKPDYNSCEVSSRFSRDLDPTGGRALFMGDCGTQAAAAVKQVW